MKTYLMMISAITVLLSGCGNTFPLYNAVGQQITLSNALDAAARSYPIAPNEGGESACSGPSSAILSQFSESDALEVCQTNVTPATGSNATALNPISAIQILIYRQTKASNGYCVFPTITDSSGNLNFMFNPNTNHVLYACGIFGPSGLSLSFSMTGISRPFNSLFIIDSSQLNKMNVCIQSQMSSGCPNYYFGEFISNFS